MTESKDSVCPCGSAKAYSACCAPVIKDLAQAKTALDLMRARYSAYVKGEIAFLKESFAAEKRAEFDEVQVRKWSKESTWKGFELVKQEGGEEKDKSGFIEFIAHFVMEGKDQSHHEVAQFERGKDGLWYFVDGFAPRGTTYKREEPKIGRNDPCTCGSQKKYKKCCGAA